MDHTKVFALISLPTPWDRLFFQYSVRSQCQSSDSAVLSISAEKRSVFAFLLFGESINLPFDEYCTTITEVFGCCTTITEVCQLCLPSDWFSLDLWPSSPE
mmetsp:Transcript_28803/g.65564  ORF Transcript_28803/g.65564 Transcript_28803/m.65564 type:complete len:101 (+) Transcript_28803:132-434(+)